MRKLGSRILQAGSLRLGGVALIALVIASCSSASAASRTPATATGSLTVSGALTGTFTQGAAVGCGAITSPGPTQLNGEVDFGDLRLRFLGSAGSDKLPLGGETLGLVDVSTASNSWSAGQDSPASLGTLTLSERAGDVIQGSIDATLTPDNGSTGTLHVTGSWSCHS
jgi:hypothetical protein